MLFRHACKLIQTRMHNACVYYKRMQLLTPSLNNRSKLKGQFTEVKSGCDTSVGPSLNPHSPSQKQNSCATVPLSHDAFAYHTTYKTV